MFRDKKLVGGSMIYFVLFCIVLLNVSNLVQNVNTQSAPDYSNDLFSDYNPSNADYPYSVNYKNEDFPNYNNLDSITWSVKDLKENPFRIPLEQSQSKETNDLLSQNPSIIKEDIPNLDFPKETSEFKGQISKSENNFEETDNNVYKDYIQPMAHYSSLPTIPSFNLPFQYDKYAPDFGNLLKENDGFSMLSLGKYDVIGDDVYLGLGLFVFLYLMLAVLLKDIGSLFEKKCDNWGWEGFQEWTFKAEPRFLPAILPDPKMQQEFLKLFRTVRKKEEDKSGSSSSEEGSMEYGYEMSYINELCPRDAFFYGMSPMHIEAYTSLQRMFVSQKSPADVLHLAKKLLLKVNPKIWYIGLLAASIQRTDMTGFALASALDAMPDLFIPAHLINKEEFGKGYKTIGFKTRMGVNMPSNHSSPIVTKKSIGKAVEKSLIMKNNKTSNISSSVSHPKTKMKSTKRRYRRDLDVEIDKDFVAHPRKTREAKLIMIRNFTNTTKLISGKGRQLKGYSYGYENQKQGNNHKDKGKGKGWYSGKKKKKKGKGNGKGDKDKKKECLVVDGSIGRDNGIENKLWYWREDMMVNLHHLYWHQVYPVNATRHGDRRAELFFFMHRSMLARYNSERLANGFDRTYVQGLDYGDILLEGYDSHLADVNSGKFWTPRPPFTPLADAIHIHDPDFIRNILIENIQELIRKFRAAIKKGKLVTPGGHFLPIRKTKGIHPLGNTIEASELSINGPYYDAFGLHNLGHLIVALAVDPEWKQKIPTGVMSDAGVSMRDPSFYTYHTVIDDLFDEFKHTLHPYQIVGGEYPLLWVGVEILDVEIISDKGGSPNELTTFYRQKKFKLSPGVDGSIYKGKDDAQVCATHLDHEPFMFKIVIDRKPCAKSKSGKATVRLSMAPRFDEHGKRLSLVEQRRLIFPLDTFQVDLKVGRNIITRRDDASSLTKPWVKTLKELESGPDPTGAADFCACGWPRHLYIPRGTVEGMSFDLFVMVTNFDHDYVENDPRDLEIPETCNSPYIFCGLPRRLYPDSKPMGYPFDRPPYRVPINHCGYGISSIICKLLPSHKTRPVANLEEYVAPVQNMATIPFGIKHLGHTY